MKLGYLGSMNIPEQDREEFALRVLELMQQGGMMQIKRANYCGMEIKVLAEPEFNSQGSLHACYNYFSEEDRLDMAFQAENADFWVPETGSETYRKVVHGIHALYEQYAGEPGLAMGHDFSREDQKALGWINAVCDADYCEKTKQERLTICHFLLEKYGAAVPLRMYWDGPSLDEIQTTIEEHCMGDEELYDALPHSTANDYISLAYDVLNEIKASDGPQSEKLLFMELAGLMPDNPMWMEAHNPRWWKWYVILVRILPVEILKALTVQVFGSDIEKTAAEPPILRLPADRVSTAEYLGISGGDRLYYWLPGGDVILSEETEQWLLQLKQEYQTALEMNHQMLDSDQALWAFLRAMMEADWLFHKVYCLEETLTDFMGHAEDAGRQTVLMMFKQRILQHQDSAVPAFGRWDCVPEPIKRHPVRQELRRFLAVWANPKLRERVFGF